MVRPGELGVPEPVEADGRPHPDGAVTPCEKRRDGAVGQALVGAGRALVGAPDGAPALPEPDEAAAGANPEAAFQVLSEFQDGFLGQFLVARKAAVRIAIKTSDGADPERSPLIRQHRVDPLIRHGVGGAEGAELVAVDLQQSLLAAGPHDAGGVLGEAMKAVVADRRRVAAVVDPERDAVVAGQTSLGRQPKESPAALEDGLHCILGQAAVAGPGVEPILGDGLAGRQSAGRGGEHQGQQDGQEKPGDGA